MGRCRMREKDTDPPLPRTHSTSFLSLWLYSYFPSEVSPLPSVPMVRDLACASQNQAVLPPSGVVSHHHPNLSPSPSNYLSPSSEGGPYCSPGHSPPPLSCFSRHASPSSPTPTTSHCPSIRLPNLRRYLLFNWRIPGSGPYSLIDSPSSEEAREKA